MNAFVSYYCPVRVVETRVSITEIDVELPTFGDPIITVTCECGNDHTLSGEDEDPNAEHERTTTAT